MHVHNVPKTFQVMHHLRALVELYQCTNFRVTPSKFPEVKKCLCNIACAVFICARAMHVHYATYHQMQCTIELHTLNSSSVPNLVSLAQNFLEPQDPSRIKFFFGPGGCSLHPTRKTTRKAYRLGQYTCDLQVWVLVSAPIVLGIVGGGNRALQSGANPFASAICTCTLHWKCPVEIVRAPM